MCAGHSKIFIDQAKDFTYCCGKVRAILFGFRDDFSKCKQFLTFCVLLKRVVASHEQMMLCMTSPECARSQQWEHLFDFC